MLGDRVGQLNAKHTRILDAMGVSVKDPLSLREVVGSIPNTFRPATYTTGDSRYFDWSLGSPCECLCAYPPQPVGVTE